MELKFRVWDTENKDWISERDGADGPIFTIGFDGKLRRQYYSGHSEYSGIIQSFTGLQDSKGKDIYEGDIFQVRSIEDYELFDELGNFVGYSDDEKLHVWTHVVERYCGDYPVNCHEYTIGYNGWISRVVSESVKTTLTQVNSIRPLSSKCGEANFGFYGLEAAQIEIIGNIFENPELLNV